MFFVFRNNHNARRINKCGYKLVCNTSSTASGPPCLAEARSHSGKNNTQLFSYTLVPLRYPLGKA